MDPLHFLPVHQSSSFMSYFLTQLKSHGLSFQEHPCQYSELPSPHHSGSTLTPHLPSFLFLHPKLHSKEDRCRYEFMTSRLKSALQHCPASFLKFPDLTLYNDLKLFSSPCNTHLHSPPISHYSQGKRQESLTRTTSHCELLIPLTFPASSYIVLSFSLLPRWLSLSL